MARMSPKKRVTDRSVDSTKVPDGVSVQYSPLRSQDYVPSPKRVSKGADRKNRKPKAR